MTYFISISLAIFFSCAAATYDKFHKEKKIELNTLNFFSTSKKLWCFLMPIFIVISVVGNFIRIKVELDYMAFLRWLVLIFVVLYISIIDCKERIIPNKLILFLLGIRIFILIYEVIQSIDLWRMVIWIPILGMLIGGLTILLGMFISRKGVGGGDIKLYAIIGLYVGSYYILGTLFYSFLYSAIYGLYLLIFKKAKVRDSIPMAPFALLGVVTSFGFLCIGG